MTDASGSTLYCYDERGNVTRKSQLTLSPAGVVPTSHTYVVSQTFNLADRVMTTTYPAGIVIATPAT